MSNDAHPPAHDDGHGHGHGQSPFIQHHYDDAKHQFESGKLGIWLFLAQEILFFSGLFVAYIILRHNHPEAFEYAHKYLDVRMGAINTVVLIFSSLTAAWAVRAAQLGQQRLLIACLTVTILCACAFLVVKYFEYTHKIHQGTLYGYCFQPEVTPNGTKLIPSSTMCLHSPAERAALAAEAKEMGEAKEQAEAAYKAKLATLPPMERAKFRAAHPLELAKGIHSLEVTELYEHNGIDFSQPPPPNTGMFFTVYFAMTGLHGIHVVGGIFVFIWLLIRARKRHFTPEYYGPVDYAALYWHLVDLIWIFLFPLLYLIH